MLAWLFATPEMKVHALYVLCAVGADSLMAAAVTFSGIDTVGGCDTMISLLADTSRSASLPAAIVRAGSLYRIQFNAYLDSLAKDSTIYADAGYANPSGGYTGLLESAVAHYGNEDKVINFFSGYLGGQGYAESYCDRGGAAEYLL
jgi:hypothetical protein